MAKPPLALPQLLVFTDLDGSLLDSATYSWEPAREALEALRLRQIPLVLVSSKTRAEIESLRIDLKHRDPFITENGGAVFIPQGYFHDTPEDGVVRDGFQVIELGTPHSTLRQALREIELAVGAPLRGFRDMSPDEVSRHTGLPLADAELSMEREYDEPFLIEGPGTLIRAVEREARDRGLSVTKGGRFHHLLGDSDKGRACLHLLERYRRHWQRPPRTVLSVGLGDSANDLPMLRVVDYPVVIQRPDGSYDPDVQLSYAIQASAPGPAGWNAAMLGLLGTLLTDTPRKRTKPTRSTRTSAH